jgi:hypothetical protein
MLKWKTSTLKGQKRYSATVNRDADSDAVLEALTHFWSKILDEVESQPESFTWDFLIVQFVTQGGTLIAFPTGKKSGDQMSSPFTVWLTLRDWGRAYDELPDPDESETKFERAYNKLHKSQTTALKKALGGQVVKKRFDALKRRDSFAVFCVDEGNAAIRDRLEFLWGNRPGKREFADAMELFTHVFRKAESYPDHSIIRIGEKLVAVNWFGEEFSNKYVAILEDVPNIAELCADLKDFILTATRVDAAGVGRLEAILPHTKMTYVSGDEWSKNPGNDPWNALKRKLTP